MAENQMTAGKPAKKGSSLIKDAFALFLITLVAAVALGFVYELTKDIIKERERQEKEAAYRAVYPLAAMIDENDEVKAAVEQADAILSDGGFENVSVNEAMVAKDADGVTEGYVLNVSSGNGYGGEIALSMGYTKEGTLLGIEFTTLNETAGLGMRASEEGEGSFKSQFENKNVDGFTLVKGGAAADGEINAISAATITSTAVTEAVNAGIYFANQMLSEGIGGIGQ